MIFLFFWFLLCGSIFQGPPGLTGRFYRLPCRSLVRRLATLYFVRGSGRSWGLFGALKFWRTPLPILLSSRHTFHILKFPYFSSENTIPLNDSITFLSLSQPYSRSLECQASYIFINIYTAGPQPPSRAAQLRLRKQPAHLHLRPNSTPLAPQVGNPSRRNTFSVWEATNQHACIVKIPPTEESITSSICLSSSLESHSR